MINRFLRPVLLMLGSGVAPWTLAMGQSFTLQPEIGQDVAGWGFTPTPLEWDGTTMLRDASITERLYRDSGASVIRLPLPGSAVYDNEARRLRKDVASKYLLPQIKILKAAGNLHYIISLLSPPAYMKRYYSVAGYVDGAPNGMRVECEELLASYMADILGQIKAAGAELPIAISVQAQPDVAAGNFGCPPSTAQGAIYAPEQMIRVIVKTRRVLDAAGLSEVRVIGPECYDQAWALRVAEQLSRDRNALAALGGFSLAQIQRTASSGDPATFPPLPLLADGQKPIWVLSTFTTHARSDQDVLLETFAQMRHAFVDVHASYWFWRYGFTWEHSAESLVSGRTYDEAPIAVALRTLWRNAPPGSRVRTFGSHDQSSGMGIFGFENTTGFVVILYNETQQPTAASVGGLGQRTGKVQVFFDGACRESAVTIDRTLDWRQNLPRRSVIIGFFRPPPP